MNAKLSLRAYGPLKIVYNINNTTYRIEMPMPKMSLSLSMLLIFLHITSMLMGSRATRPATSHPVKMINWQLIHTNTSFISSVFLDLFTDIQAPSKSSKTSEKSRILATKREHLNYLFNLYFTLKHSR